MHKSLSVFFWVYFLTTLLTGSLALTGTADLNQKLLLALPLLLALITFNSIAKPQLNKTLFWLLSIFALTMLTAFLFSQHYGNSATHLVRWLSGLSVFVFAIWFGPEIRPKLAKILMFLGIFFSLFFLALNYLPQYFGFLMQQNGYNLVFPTYRLHNHLGDFLVLPVIVLIYNLRQGKKPLFTLAWIIVFGLLIFYSYSRSSYTALGAGLVTLFFTQLKQKSKFSQLVSLTLLLIGAILFLLLTTQESNLKLSFFSAIENKLLLNGRDQYWGASIKAIQDYFWFGIGEGNFVYAMGRYSSIPFNWTESSLNLFLSVFSENGVFAFVVFMALVIWVIKNNRFDLNFVLLTALLINFQTDYTYEIVGMWLLFWLIMGLSVRHNPAYQPIRQNWLILPGLIGILLLLQLVITPVLGLFRLHSLAFIANPLDSNNQEKLIINQLFTQKYSQAELQLCLYQRFYRADFSRQYATANYYLALNQPQKALASYYQAYLWNPYANLDVYRQIYELETKLNGKEKANLFLQNYQKQIDKITGKSYFAQKLKKDWQEFNKKLDKKPQL